ncbi:hypothetical protein Taro_056972 [Colocasia esculenta]|uniref:Uncharacterized protein n=1 Tax=Colocasia esculenta TaxID=4460 RepID=A0A843XY12_COLES|nr:hypothetical protein [Colocasia esculenta]
MDVWSWITHLPDPGDWPETSDAALDFKVASSPAKSIVLRAERTAGSDSEALATFLVCLEGFHPSNSAKTLWVSNPCALSADGSHDFRPLVLQLVQEVIARAPSCDPAAGPPKLDLRPLFAASQFSNFFELVFLCRLFWLCACDSPGDVGYLYFQAMNPALVRALDCKDAMREFLASAGVDWEIYFMRSLGYMLAKWCILRELSPTESGATELGFGFFSYAIESHGLWVLRGYAPVLAMERTHHHHQGHPDGYAALEAKEPLLRYALAHQQLEAVLQLEYSASSREGDRFIRVGVRVDNLRLHIARLAFAKRDPCHQVGDGQEPASPTDERHFPSRVRVWVGPELGFAGVSCLSLGRSTENPEREVEREQTVNGSFGESKFPRVRATARISSRSRARSWRWEQEAEGNLAVFEGVLSDTATGAEVATWRPKGKGADPRGEMRRRYAGPGRAFSKAGGLVVAGDEYGEWVWWRVGREMEGKALQWRVGWKVWVTYWPNELKTPYMETRCVEWRDEVVLPL